MVSVLDAIAVSIGVAVAIQSVMLGNQFRSSGSLLGRGLAFHLYCSVVLIIGTIVFALLQASGMIGSVNHNAATLLRLSMFVAIGVGSRHVATLIGNSKG